MKEKALKTCYLSNATICRNPRHLNFRCIILSVLNLTLFRCFQAINAVRIQAEINQSRAVLEERANKDIAIQQALQQARADKQPAAEQSLNLVTDGKNAYNITDGKNTYSIAWINADGAQQAVLQPGSFLSTADIVDISEEKEKG